MEFVSTLLTLPGSDVFMNSVRLSGSKISQKLASTFSAFLKASVSVELGQFMGIKARPDMQSVDILRNEVLEIAFFFKFE